MGRVLVRTAGESIEGEVMTELNAIGRERYYVPLSDFSTGFITSIRNDEPENFVYLKVYH